MKKIWIKDNIETINFMAGFVYKLKKTAGNVVLNVAGASAFRIFINGVFTGYGPRRSAHGYSIINSYDISNEANKGDVTVCAEIIGYNNNSYNLVLDLPFFSIELKNNEKIIAQSTDFTAYHIDSKVQKVERFSFQRNFAEVYRLRENPLSFYKGQSVYKKAETVEVCGNQLIWAELPYAKFEEMPLNNIIESGEIYPLEDYYHFEFPAYARVGENCIGYLNDELEIYLSDEICKTGYKADGRQTLNLTNRYNLYDLGKNKTGFISLKINALTDSIIFLTFDEIIYNEIKNDPNFSKFFSGKELPLVFYRSGTLNAVEFIIKKGSYDLLTIEPYTLRYLKIFCKGSAVIEKASFILYENYNAYNMEFRTSDKNLQKVFDAAQSTFAQNAVDVLTDCPSRERAGWLCDSYFSAQAELLFSGKNEIEKNFLNNFVIMPHLKELPADMLPMCYPSDHINGNYIPNWSMWFVLELEDYVKRTKDTLFAEKCKDKVINLAEFFINNYSNEDVLLEKLDKWVFVEWSRANALVQDVNYPTNMLFAAMLKSIYNLYGIEKYNVLSKKIKKTITEQSYNGKFFEDNRKRIDGKLVKQNESTETCQYYAFYFGLADKERYPELYETMFTKFGPLRDYKKVYPEVSKSNAFIGNFMRLDYLMKCGQVLQVLKECAEYLGFMADRTGTLWEHDSPTASCNHCFASYAANWITQAVTGYKGFDSVKKEIYLTKPALNTDYYAKIPVENGFVVLISGKLPEVPDNYKIKYLEK